jgi:uncharacterized membrane protein
MNKSFIATILLTALVTISAKASGMDDVMRSGLKYPIVVGVLLCIFIGIAIFLILLERRISKLEK